MAFSRSLRRLIAIVLLAVMLACTDTLQAVMISSVWERRRLSPEPFDDGLQPEHDISAGSERGDDLPEVFTRKARPTPKVPAAYIPQAKPQPKPRPGAKATPPPSAPAPTPPITRPT